MPTWVSRVVISGVVLAGLLAGPESAGAAWPHDPNNGNLPVCTAGNDQLMPAVTPDGAGGVFVTWYDLRGGSNYDIYAQRISAAGVPQWPANGAAVCTATGDQRSPVVVSDGAGGAIIAWFDLRTANYDVYAQRLNSAGVPQWTTNGVALCAALGDQLYNVIASDGAGGAIVAWQDSRSGNPDIYAQRVNSAGVPQWATNGVPLCTAAGTQTLPSILSDGAGGAFVGWSDLRGGATYDVYAQRINGAGTVQLVNNGLAVCALAGDQELSALAPDGMGGAILTWSDLRSGNSDIYSQRLNAAGATLWTANGVAVCTATGSQGNPTIASDSAGGAIITWTDFRGGAGADIYVQRLSSAGVPLWTPNGILLCSAANDQGSPTIISDGAHGAVVAWHDYRSGNTDIYAQRISASGAALWALNGVALSTALGGQVFPAIAPDGKDGAIIAWYDSRSGNNDIYAQRVEPFGQLGNPEPVITSVSDVPNDQGGKVKVVWSPSYLDTDPSYGIGSYWVWRSVPPNDAAIAIAQGGRLADEVPGPPSAGVRTFRVRSMGAQTFAWEYVGSQAARGFSSYSMVVSTTSDSISGSNPCTGFLVQANAGLSSAFWISAPDSGYSADDLPPAAPAPFLGNYASGATHLHWGGNLEADLASYRVYRGTSSSFVPGPGNRIVDQPDTGYADAGSAGSYYKLSAVDSHGNESLFALLTPQGTASVGPAKARELALRLVSANPGRGGASLRFSLPVGGPVRLALYDVSGRETRLLASGDLAAGDYDVRWDGRSGAGRMVSGGVYMARLEAEGRSLIQRLVLVP